LGGRSSCDPSHHDDRGWVSAGIGADAHYILDRASEGANRGTVFGDLSLGPRALEGQQPTIALEQWQAP
jgi:hypothetical protein